MSYISLTEAAKKLGIGYRHARRLMSRGEFAGAIKVRGSWEIPLEAVESYMASLNLQVMGDVRYIPKDCVEKYLESLTPPEVYITTTQAAEELSLTQAAVSSLAKKGAFPGAKKQNNGSWIIPIESISLFKESRAVPNDHVSSSYIATSLGVSRVYINRLFTPGVIPRGIKSNNEWFVPTVVASNFIEREQKKHELSTPLELFEFRFAELEIPDTLQQTVELFREFVTLKINSFQGNNLTSHNSALHYMVTLKRFLQLFTNEVFKLDVGQLEHIFQNPELRIMDKKIFVLFLEFCEGKGLCSFSKNFAVKPLPIEEREMYSPKQFFDYYTYVKDINLHIHQAIHSRDYAVTWLYVLMHVIDAWRPSDIVTLPNISLEACNIQTFDQLKETNMSLDQAQAVINHLYKHVDRMYISKTGGLGHFLVNQDMIIPTATVLVIAEIHRRIIGDQQLVKVGQKKFVTFVKDLHLRPFFGNRPDLVDFQSRKMNRTLLTYFFYSIVSGNGNANIAYEMSQQVRGHKCKESTATYIQAINKDGPLEQISLNLFNRGHFGWLYNYLVRLSMPNVQQLELEQNTALIEQFRKEFSPYQLEQFSFFLIRQQQSKSSLAMRLSNLSTKDLNTLLHQIYKGELPAKLKHVQCLTYPSCTSPAAITCLNCENAIPKIYILISIHHELDRLITSIQNTIHPAVRIRDRKFLFQILDLLSQAVQQFGKEYVHTFIDLNHVKEQLISIQNLINEEV